MSLSNALQQERDALATKLDALINFITAGYPYREIGDFEMSLLRQQTGAMTLYLAVLEQRLAVLEQRLTSEDQ